MKIATDQSPYPLMTVLWDVGGAQALVLTMQVSMLTSRLRTGLFVICRLLMLLRLYDFGHVG